jgi:hypothetical protein
MLSGQNYEKNLLPAAVNYGVRSSGLVFEGLRREREPAADHRLLHHQVVVSPTPVAETTQRKPSNASGATLQQLISPKRLPK